MRVERCTPQLSAATTCACGALARPASRTVALKRGGASQGADVTTHSLVRYVATIRDEG